ncbi:seizure protein 6 homolog [Ptychodera flava]|uniref:seizure protein 6 homolog n=1 Tax=Ptychodera flava TaxID=63121 RepID=UPI00396A9E3B
MTTIYSPGFPGSYSPNESCSWTPETSTDGVLGTELIFLNLGRHDALEISESSDVGWHYFENLSTPIYSCSNKIQLSFVSRTRNLAEVSFIVKFREAIPDCRSPFNVTDQSVIFESFCPYFHGDVVSITCKRGYELDSVHGSIECLEDGKWNDTVPQCAETPKTGSIIGALVGTLVTVVVVMTVATLLVVFIRKRMSGELQQSTVLEYYEVSDFQRYENVSTRDRSIDPVSSQQQYNVEDINDETENRQRKQYGNVDNIAYESAGKGEDNIYTEISDTAATDS